ncbi:6,7-dimethyl-8-ribityllumazine synthase [Galdieria sulphuraria]|nr:6,7-dimethyl-8-ribityllumazine synthase [Galdieria sulphuraria]
MTQGNSFSLFFVTQRNPLALFVVSPWQGKNAGRTKPLSNKHNSCCDNKHSTNTLCPTFVRKVRHSSVGVREILCKKESSKGVEFGVLDGSTLRVGIVYSRWNDKIVRSLLKACKDTLFAHKVDPSNVVEFEVPGSFELPTAARYMTFSQRVDCIICIGCLIKGETSHYEMIAQAVTNGLMEIGITSNIPVVYGVLTCLTEEQAVARSSGDDNHGIAWAKTAIEMGNLKLSQFGQTKVERAIKF